MKTTMTGLAATLAACAMPVIAAPNAAAEIERLIVMGPDYGIPCSTEWGCHIRAVTHGADANDPVTITIDGEVVLVEAPTGSGPGNTAVGVDWHPVEDRTYTIVAIQGASKRSMTITLPYDYQRPESLSAGVPLPSSGSAG